MRTLPRSCLLLSLLLPLLAGAEPDTFWLGDAHHGPLVVSSGTSTPEVHAPLVASVPAGSTELELSDTSGFQPGDLIMLHQTTAALPAPEVGDVRALELEGSSVGRFELARLLGVSGPRLLLRAPLLHGFEAPGAQALLVPEYTDVRVSAGATLEAPPWDGASGGVLALLATGAVTNDGLLTASGRGLRGGQVVEDGSSTGCTGLSEPAPRGAWRGESFLSGRFGAGETGHGNLANGGGGGICHNSGGGGGGNGGPGGRGARTATGDGARPYGGLGGSALGAMGMERLLMGGGGGAGHSNNQTGTAGGRGGGLVFLRAERLVGNGTVAANGQDAAQAGNDGAGGGGAGGSLSLRVLTTLAQASLEARGGHGGDTRYSGDGPGGGGGGGRALVQGGDTSQAPLVLLAGHAGTQPGTTLPHGDHHGAEPDSEDDPAFVGHVQPLPGPPRAPSAPVLLTPTDGLLTPEPRPVVTGRTLASATVLLLVDGVAVGRVLADANGDFTFTPPADLAEGSRLLEAFTEYQGLYSPPSSLEFTVDRTAPLELLVGCGCGGSPGAGAMPLALLLLLGARPRRRPPLPVGERPASR